MISLELITDVFHFRILVTLYSLYRLDAIWDRTNTRGVVWFTLADRDALAFRSPPRNRFPVGLNDSIHRLDAIHFLLHRHARRLGRLSPLILGGLDVGLGIEQRMRAQFVQGGFRYVLSFLRAPGWTSSPFIQLDVGLCAAGKGRQTLCSYANIRAFPIRF